MQSPPELLIHLSFSTGNAVKKLYGKNQKTRCFRRYTCPHLPASGPRHQQRPAPMPIAAYRHASATRTPTPRQRHRPQPDTSY